MVLLNDPIWYPYAQHKVIPDPFKVISADGVTLTLEDGTRLIDSVSSWWCMIHGYSHPELVEAAKEQLDKVAHVMQGGITNVPAQELARRLVAITPGDLNHVFYADSGSVAMEIAMKMAMQFWRNQGKTERRHFVTLRRAYHGDTGATMSLCDPEDGYLALKTNQDTYHDTMTVDFMEHPLFEGLVATQYFLPYLDMGIDGSHEAVMRHVQILDDFLAQKKDELVALVLEPILQGAGGLRFYPPLYLTEARRLCDTHDVLLIVDEVATCLGRTGTLFACEQAGITPDIMALGKALFGGMVGHAVTMATDKIFQAFYSDDQGKCMMHGTTFQGNPLACAIALKGLEIFERDRYLDRIAAIEAQLKDELLGFEHPLVKEVRVLGAVGVIEVHDPSCFAHLRQHVLETGVWLRPFESVLYTMPPYVITADELTQVTRAMKDYFRSYSNSME